MPDRYVKKILFAKLAKPLIMKELAGIKLTSKDFLRSIEE